MNVIKQLKYYRDAGLDPFSTLETEYGIKVREYDCGTVVLNYNQIDQGEDGSKFHPIVRECRSLVISKDFELISRSFCRFFNLGEGENEVDFSNAVAYEKLDGSLISLYWNPLKAWWCFRSRSMAFAEGENDKGICFTDMIDNATGFPHSMLNDELSHLSKDKTFIFELVSPLNRIVTRYLETSLVLIGVRDHSGKYYDIEDEIGSFYRIFKNVRLPKTFPIRNIKEIHELIESLENLEEGFVVVDSNWNRVKVKSPAYLIAHKIRGEGLNKTRAIELVLENDYEEYLTVFPEDTEYIMKLVDAKNELLKNASVVYESIKDLEVQKDFALEAMKHPFFSILFTARKDKISVEKAFLKQTPNYRFRLLDSTIEEKLGDDFLNNEPFVKKENKIEDQW